MQRHVADRQGLSHPLSIREPCLPCFSPFKPLKAYIRRKRVFLQIAYFVFPLLNTVKGV